MICPMKFIRLYPTDDPNVTCRCEGNKCAWWNRYYSRCSIGIDQCLEGRKTAEEKPKQPEG